MARNLVLLAFLLCVVGSQAIRGRRRTPSPPPKYANCFKCQTTRLNEVCVTSDYSTIDVKKCNGGCGRGRWQMRPYGKRCRCRKCPGGTKIISGYYLEIGNCGMSGTGHPTCKDAVKAQNSCPLAPNSCSRVAWYLEETLNSAGSDLGAVANALLSGGGLPVIGSALNAIGVYLGAESTGQAISALYDQVLQQMKSLRGELLSCIQPKLFEHASNDIDTRMQIIRESISKAIKEYRTTSAKKRLSHTWLLNFAVCRNDLVGHFMKTKLTNLHDSYIILDFAAEVLELCLLNYRAHIADYAAVNKNSRQLKNNLKSVTKDYGWMAEKIRDSVSEGLKFMKKNWQGKDKCGLTPGSRRRLYYKIKSFEDIQKSVNDMVRKIAPPSHGAGAILRAALILPNTSVTCNSATWKDSFGHSCSWYTSQGICSSSGYVLDYLTRAVEHWGYSMTGQNSLSCCQNACKIPNTTNSSSSTIVFSLQVRSNLNKAEAGELTILSLAKTLNEPLSHFFLVSSFELASHTFVISIAVERSKFTSAGLRDMGRSGNENSFVPWIQRSVRHILVNTTHTFNPNANLNVTHSSALFSESATAVESGNGSGTGHVNEKLIIWMSVGAGLVVLLACVCGLIAVKRKDAMKSQTNEVTYNLLEHDGGN